MVGYRTEPLDATTWPDIACLVEANNGVWGGYWCIWYHGIARELTPMEKREAKKRLVREGRAHALLVFDGGACVG